MGHPPGLPGGDPVTAEARTIPVVLDPVLAEGLTALVVVDGMDEGDVMCRALAAYLRVRFGARPLERAGACR